MIHFLLVNRIKIQLNFNLFLSLQEIISVSAGEDGVWAKKRRLSVELDDHNIMDSFPGTPMSICSESSATAKIKLKIKVKIKWMRMYLTWINFRVD